MEPFVYPGVRFLKGLNGKTSADPDTPSTQAVFGPVATNSARFPKNSATASQGHDQKPTQPRKNSQSSSSTNLQPRPPYSQWNYNPVVAGSGNQRSSHTSTSSLSNGPSNAPVLPIQGPQLLYSCQHCETYFADNILYTIHMGCHGYENPFQCNICGQKCRNKYDFACHFVRGQHHKI